MTPKEYYERSHPIDLGIVTKEETIKLMEEYANQDKWISVKDELPENEVSVLVFIEGQIEIDAYDKDGWIDHYYDVRQITHWQTLPAPPKQ